MDVESPVTRPPFWLPSTIEVARNGRNSPFNRKQPTVGANYLLNKGLLEQKLDLTSLTVGSFTSGPESQGGVMTTLQAICLGAMLAWTPSLVVFALLLREPALDELQRDPS